MMSDHPENYFFTIVSECHWIIFFENHLNNLFKGHNRVISVALECVNGYYLAKYSFNIIQKSKKCTTTLVQERHYYLVVYRVL